MSKFVIAKMNTKTGFTLIEMLVSLGLFAVVVTIGMGTLITLTDANAKSQSVQIAADNLAFALDAISRQMRTGYDYYCGSGVAVSDGTAFPSGSSNCTSGSAVAFTDSRTGWRYGYQLNGTSLMRKIDKATPGTWQSVTASGVIVHEFDLEVTGTGLSDDQPTATIYMEIEVGNQLDLGSYMALQTSVTQRQLKL